MEKEHWYSFCFMQTDPITNTMTFGNGYSGLRYQRVTLQAIETAREYAGVTDGAVLMSVSYLGYMTVDQFREGLN